MYYYMRSLAASNAFITARESLMSLFDEARKRVYHFNSDYQTNELNNFKNYLSYHDYQYSKYADFEGVKMCRSCTI